MLSSCESKRELDMTLLLSKDKALLSSLCSCNMVNVYALNVYCFFTSLLSFYIVF